MKQYTRYHITTPIHAAAMASNFEMVEKLISYGASVNHKDSTGCTALHWVACSGHLSSTKTENVRIAPASLSLCPHPCIHSTIRFLDHPFIASHHHLVRSGQLNLWYLPLFFASFAYTLIFLLAHFSLQCVRIAQRLLKDGVDVTVEDDNNKTAIELTGKPNPAFNAMRMAILKSARKKLTSQLLEACRECDTETVNRVLKAGANCEDKCQCL